MQTHSATPDCFPPRIARAGQHLDRGEWATGHAIASGLLKCAAGGGCAKKTDCACAAATLIGNLRRQLA
jgi:hypothetical protein